MYSDHTATVLNVSMLEGFYTYKGKYKDMKDLFMWI
jgi:hypothetical protein